MYLQLKTVFVRGNDYQENGVHGQASVAQWPSLISNSLSRPTHYLLHAASQPETIQDSMDQSNSQQQTQTSLKIIPIS